LKLHLGLDDGGEIVFCDARRLGRVRLRHDPRAEPPISLLGFDALHDLPSLGRLAQLFGARAAPVKAVLLDQSFSAGVGNWIADEVLYQARIDPRRRTNTLTRAEIARLRTRLRSVVGTAVRVGADSDRFPPKWLFHTRWSKRLQSPVTVRGERIRYLTVGGRTTAWVAEVQRWRGGMMANNAPGHLVKWIEEHQTLFSGPVANKEAFPDGELSYQLVRGPNARNDFHLDPGDE